MDAGCLPNLALLRTQGAYGRLTKQEHHSHESSWSQFLFGVEPEITGHWRHASFDPKTYRSTELLTFSDCDYPPFFAIAPAPRSVLFDVSYLHTMPELSGGQLFGWGTEANQYCPESCPPELIEEVKRRFGPHPVYHGSQIRIIEDDPIQPALAFRNPSLYDQAALLCLVDNLIAGIERRMAITDWLIEEYNPEFFLLVFSELHIGGHLLWHMDSLPHPLKTAAGAEIRALQRLYEAIDVAVGKVVGRLPRGATLCLFSAFSGMKENATDLMLNLFLPEFLYRWSFECSAIAEGTPGQPVPTAHRQFSAHWKDEIWALATAAGRDDLQGPAELEREQDPLDWNPTHWYKRLWPKMRAFCLPTYYQGLVRINVAGREGAGQISPDGFAEECRRLTSALMRLTDARTGQALVRRVLQTRQHPDGSDDLGAAADLIVIWNNGSPVDTVDSPDIGRIGPVPYFRSGGHGEQGFALIKGPTIPPATSIPEGSAVHQLTAQLMTCMGRPLPPWMSDGGWFRR
ncbi:MAG: hypothetical protein EA400_16110 [Chromatiaceae bacterium]|nr:MAG: hypothetical protein EA400_16110 [Chromatiaceae bacterium]